MSRPRMRVKADASPTRPYPRQLGQHVVLSLPRDSGCDVIASLPEGGEGEVGDEPGPEGGGDEAGDGEGEEEAGESEEDNPEGAEGMDAGRASVRRIAQVPMKASPTNT